MVVAIQYKHHGNICDMKLSLDYLLYEPDYINRFTSLMKLVQAHDIQAKDDQCNRIIAYLNDKLSNKDLVHRKQDKCLKLISIAQQYTLKHKRLF